LYRRQVSDLIYVGCFRDQTFVSHEYGNPALEN
jgi:hypothetical protein